MKKALALFMALVMICSVVATLSTVSATGAQAAPVLDGVISDGEYTYSVTTNVNDLSAGAKTEVEGTEVVEYFAYNATYLYYGIVFTQTADNRACWPQYKVNNTFNVYVDTEKADTADFHSRHALQARYLADGSTKNNGITCDAGTAPIFETDVFVTATKDANNVKTYEFKFSLAYLAANAGCEAADVRVVPMWTWFHDQTSTAHAMTAEDMLVLEDAGIGSIRAFAQGSTMYHFIVLDTEAKDEKYENLANQLGLVYYVGEPVAEEPVVEEPDEIYPMDVLGADYTDTYVGFAASTAPVADGAIGADEYTYSRVIKPYDHLLLEDEGPDVYGETYDNYITEYFAYDADYIYYAYSFLRDDTPTQGFVMQIPLEDNYTLKSIGTPGNRQLNATKALTITGSTGDACSLVADGAAAPVKGTDVSVYKTIGTGNTTYVEFKISKQYLATARGVEKSDIDSFEYTVYENWNYYAVPAGSSWGYVTIDHHVTDEEAALLTAAGAEAVPARIYNTVRLAPETPKFNLEELYGATYVGKALTDEDAKPVLDGVISEGEYQAEYVITADGKDTARFGVQALLLADYKQYVSHDDEYFYFAFDFYNGNSGLRGRLYWNLSFIDSFDVEYFGGNTVNGAFKQNGHGLAEGWNLGAEVKANIAEGYSDRGSTVSFGTAPVKGTDYDVAVGKEDLAEPIDEEGTSTTHQVYEIKVSKAWYAEQVGLESAADVRELAWVALAGESNLYGSSYTQFGHYISDADLAKLNATGFTYTRPAVSSHPYDNATLPFLFVLDEAPVENIKVTTKDAASVRLSTTYPGLRFTTTVNTLELNALVAKYGAENVKIGTLIAPADVLGEDALTIDTATKIDVVASLANPFAQDGTTSTYAGSITNIKPQNLTRDFTAVGYVAYSADGENWTYVYSETTCTRNVTEIAQAAVDAGEFAEDADALEILQNLGAVVA